MVLHRTVCHHQEGRPNQMVLGLRPPHSHGVAPRQEHERAQRVGVGDDGLGLSFDDPNPQQTLQGGGAAAASIAAARRVRNKSNVQKKVT